MNRSECLIVGAVTTIVITIAGACIAAELYPSITPVIAGVGSTVSAILSHEVVKTAGIRIINHLVGVPTPPIDGAPQHTESAPTPLTSNPNASTPPGRPASAHSVGSAIEMAPSTISSSPSRPRRSRTLLISTHESTTDSKGRHTSSNVQTRVEETMDGTPSDSSNSSGKSNNQPSPDDTFETAASHEEPPLRESPRHGKKGKLKHYALTVD